MTANNCADFLVELGTEEMPPTALRQLRDAFAEKLAALLQDNRLGFAAVESYATPRRLGLVVRGLALAQPDEDLVMKGPPVSVAYKDGELTQAGIAFASKCGIDPSLLQQQESDKGSWLVFETRKAGESAAALLPGIVQAALDGLPIPRRMRWGAGDAEFVRPVHWLVMLHGKDVVKGEVLGISAGAATRGHRFHAPAEIGIANAADYAALLLDKGRVIADFDARREVVVEGVLAAAGSAGGRPVADDALYDEVTALTEWPVALVGSFDKEHLALPREVIVATLQNHQRYFPIEKDDGSLLPRFVFVANLESADPGQVIDGNERVVTPRLADAAFFWSSDRKRPLAARIDSLRQVVYQQGLGSIYDKSVRVAELATMLAVSRDESPDHSARAAMLSKCDLVCDMVGEFPELQGVVGAYYAAADGEPADVAQAIREHYAPRFAGDGLPETRAGQWVAIADKLDSLAGIFALGKKPSGNRDPFGLRRSALGLVRIIVEKRVECDLVAAIRHAVEAQPCDSDADSAVIMDDLYDYITERMRAYYVEQTAGYSNEIFESVLAREPHSLLDFDARMRAVLEFVADDAAISLAGANKRIANILRKAGDDSNAGLNPALLEEPAEAALYEALTSARRDIAPLLETREYAAALGRLAGLRGVVDRFFDDVLVMADDDAVRRNRLALLAELRGVFLNIADVSCLSIG
jgi:glycyl-tRNA synthetase beta chain